MFNKSRMSESNSETHLSKSKSQRRRTSSRTERFRCGNRDESISIAFCDTIGDFDVDETDEVSGFLLFCSDDCFVSEALAVNSLGSVTVMPKIFPGGNDSSDLPDSVDARRSAMASSTACCRFNATCREIDIR